MDIVTDEFTHAGKLYSLTKARILLRPEKAFFLKIDELLWVLKYDRPDPKRVFRAKFRYPLICAKWQGKWTVVDGLHRLERYRQRGITVIPVKHLTDDMLKQCYLHTAK